GRMRTGLLCLASTLALSAALVTAQTPATRPASAPKLTIDQLVQIKHPSGHQWTPDGRHVWWIYDDGGVNNIWAAAADGTGKPVALTNYPDSQTAAGSFWSADSQTLFYPHGGGLFAVSV